MWVKTDDTELLREPYISLSGAAYKSHHAALQMSSRLNLDGKLSKAQIRQIASPKVIGELTAAAFTPSEDLASKLAEVEQEADLISTLWIIDEDDSLFIADFFDHVMSPSQRKKQAESGRKGGRANLIQLHSEEM